MRTNERGISSGSRPRSSDYGVAPPVGKAASVSYLFNKTRFLSVFVRKNKKTKNKTKGDTTVIVFVMMQQPHSSTKKMFYRAAVAYGRTIDLLISRELECRLQIRRDDGPLFVPMQRFNLQISEGHLATRRCCITKKNSALLHGK